MKTSRKLLPKPGPHEHALPRGRDLLCERWATKLPLNPTRQQLIDRCYEYWGTNTISLKAHGRIIGCIGGHLYAWEKPDGSVAFISGPAVLKMVNTIGIGVQLRTMWFYTNHYHIVDKFGIMKGVIPYNFPWITNRTFHCEASDSC